MIPIKKISLLFIVYGLFAMLTQSSRSIDEFKYLNLLSADKSMEVDGIEGENEILYGSGRAMLYYGEIEYGNHLIDSAALRGSAIIYQNGASTNLLLGRYRSGMSYLNSAIVNGNKYSIGYKAWLMMTNLRDYEQAIILIDSLEKVDGKPTVAYAMNTTLLKGIAKRKAGRYEDALLDFDLYIIEINADNPLKIDDYVYYYKGLTYQEMGDPEKAIEEFNHFIEVYPNGPEAHYGKGNVLIEEGEIKEACKCYKIAREKIRLGYLRGFVWHEIPDQVYKSDVVEKLDLYCK